MRNIRRDVSFVGFLSAFPQIKISKNTLRNVRLVFIYLIRHFEHTHFATKKSGKVNKFCIIVRMLLCIYICELRYCKHMHLQHSQAVFNNHARLSYIYAHTCTNIHI